jgi:glycosyltransferase involved in cell wall biosynthesis
MKILLLQDFLRSGGTEQQTVSLCEYFSRSGHDVSLLTFRPGGRLAGRVGRAGIPLHSLQSFDLGVNFFAPGLFREVGRLNPDVVLCMGRMANSYAGFLRKRFENIVTVGSARTGKPLPLLNRWSFRQVDAVLANCEWWRQQLAAAGVADSRIRVVHNGVVSSWEQQDNTLARRKVRHELEAGPSTVVFLNVADFRSRKRHAWLIETFSHMRPTLDWQLWLVGDGTQWSHCRKIAEKSHVAHHIRMLGYHENPYPYYAGADVAVSASIEDSLPNFLIEAQSEGLPVIASDVRGVGETFSNGKSGFLVPPGDRVEFLSRVEKLCNDSGMRDSMGEFGARSANANFPGDGQAAKVLGVLESLVSP